MRVEFIFFVVSIVLFGAGITQAANWALLVAGSNGWYNYRHQSDVCHAYQILHKNGIPDSNIVVMMYDDLAQNPANPNKGIIINQPRGADVYHGVPKDYTGATVTPQNFINVLLGNKAAMQGIGSGKVIESGPDDNVFVYFTDHGATGLVAFPSDVLYAKDLNTTITKMFTGKKYKQMVIYIEACESGSMLENILPNNINIYATTASNAEESSYACYLDNKLATYLGDCYSVNWMENSDEKKSARETLYEQFAITKRKTHESHVMEYGDLQLGKTHDVDEFQGTEKQFQKKTRRLNAQLKRDAVATENVRISILSHRLAASENNSIEQQRLRQELVQALDDRSFIQDRIQQIISLSSSINSAHSFEELTQKRMKLIHHDCYKSVTQHIHKKCFDLQNEFVLNKLWMMANLCEIHLDEFVIQHAIDQSCPKRLDFNY
jgi:legumain